MLQPGSIPNPCLTLVTNRHLCTTLSLTQVISAAVAGGVNLVQLREKDLNGDELLRLAYAVRNITYGKASFLINGGRNIATECKADGIHLTEKELLYPSSKIRASDSSVIGQSVHSLVTARAAERNGVSFVQLGTIFESKSKPAVLGTGSQLLKKVCSAINIPVIAIGGINSSNIHEVMQAGAQGISVIRAIMDSANPQQTAYELRNLLEKNQVS